MAYIPTAKDLLWTLNSISQSRSWAVPSGGVAFIFDHSKFEFKTFTVAEKNEVQMNYFTPVITNLQSLGYTEIARVLCPGVQTTAELLKEFHGFSQDDIERNLIESLQKRPHDDRFEQR